MNQKKLVTTTMLLLLLLAFAAVASANNGPGRHDLFDQLTPEKQQVVKDIFDKHHDTMESLQGDMWAKRTELDALIRAGVATKKDIKSLVGDMASLRMKIQKEHTAVADEIEKATGLRLPPFGMGPKMGMGGKEHGHPQIRPGMDRRNGPDDFHAGRPGNDQF